MNKNLIIVLLTLIIITLTACGGSKEATSEEAQRKAIETFLESFTKEGKSKCIAVIIQGRMGRSHFR